MIGSMRIRLMAALLAAALLAGCSSAAPLTAASVARRIPGCHPRSFAGVSAYAEQEVTCDTHYASVWVATFASASLERSWLVMLGQQGGYGCVQGSGWGAAVIAPQPSGAPALRVAKALGGRLVSAGWC